MISNIRYGSLPIILDGILNNLLDPDEALKKMTDMIKQETESNVQVFEILETNSSDKFSKNNKIAALLQKSNKVRQGIKMRIDNFELCAELL